MDAAEAYGSLVGYEFDPEDFEEAYQGLWGSQEAFVYEMLDSCGTLDEWTKTGVPTQYINFKAIAHDWFASDYEWVEGHVFSVLR